MGRRVKNSLAERRLLLDFESYPNIRFHAVDRTPTGRRDIITTNSLDLRPKSLTLEILLETKKMMEIGNYQIIPADFSQIEMRVTASTGIGREYLPFWSLGAESWPNPYRTHKYEEHISMKNTGKS